MGELVAYDHTYAPIVQGIVGFLVVIGKLQYSGRKDDLVVGRTVVGRYRGGGGAPLLFVRGLVQVLDAMFIGVFSQGDHVLKIFLPFHRDIVLPPNIRVAHLFGDGIQFFLGLGLGTVA